MVPEFGGHIGTGSRGALAIVGDIATERFPAAGRARELRRRIGEVLAWTVASLADEVLELGPGWIARTPSLPLVHTLNQLHLRDPLSSGEAVSLADDQQSDLGFRHLRIDDESTAADLEGWIARDGGGGWNVEREVFMTLDAPAHETAATSGIVELHEDEMLLLMRRWHVEEHGDGQPGALDQLAEYNRREGLLWDEQVFGVRDEHGRPVAITKYRSRDGVAWIEDVYTVPEARGRGFARMLVTKAAQQARAGDHELAFIIADDNDWPKHLYEDIGFRPVGYSWTFHRNLPR